MKWWNVVKTVLGKITDVLLIGRNAGLWSQGQGPGSFREKKKQ